MGSMAKGFSSSCSMYSDGTNDVATSVGTRELMLELSFMHHGNQIVSDTADNL